MPPSRRRGARGTDLPRRLLGDLPDRTPSSVGRARRRGHSPGYGRSLWHLAAGECECLVGPIKRGDPVLQRAYTELFEQFAPFDMPEPVYLQAAQLRGHFGLRTPDALHLACAQYHGCDALWTNDDRLAHASHGLASNILK